MGIERVLKKTMVKGVFGLPIGITFLNRAPGKYPDKVLVSTACLEGGHLDSLIPGMFDAEHGYETMVFLDGSTLVHVFKQHYDTRAKAMRGHRSVVRRLLAQKLPLAIPLGYYAAWDSEEVVKST